jgi:hypothetical protein
MEFTKFAAAALTAALIAVGPARADLVTLTYGGHVADVNDSGGFFGGSIAVGTSVTGTLVFDSAAFTSTNPGSGSVDYLFNPNGANGLTVQAGVLTFAPGSATTLTVSVFGPGSAFPGVSAINPLDANGSFASLDLFDSNSVLSDTSLPSVAQLSQLTNGLFTVEMHNGSAASGLHGTIDSFSVNGPGPVGTVPEPSGLSLAVAGLALVLARRRPRA